MPMLTLFHGPDCFEVRYNQDSVLHIDKLMGESQTRREVVFDELPEVIQHEILLTINLDD